MTTKKIIAFSAKTGEGLEELQQYITNQFFQNEISFNQEIYLSNERQKQAVSEAYESLLRVTIFSTSSSVSCIPAVSIKCKNTSPILTFSSNVSLVVPGTFVTIARSVPSIAI